MNNAEATVPLFTREGDELLESKSAGENLNKTKVCRATRHGVLKFLRARLALP